MQFTKRILTGTAAIAALAVSMTAAQADTWRYAFEEAITDVQCVFATKFKEEVEANSDHEIQLFQAARAGLLLFERAQCHLAAG